MASTNHAQTTHQNRNKNLTVEKKKTDLNTQEIFNTQLKLRQNKCHALVKIYRAYIQTVFSTHELLLHS